MDDNRYNHRKIEAKWQAIWEERQVYRAVEDPARPKYYLLIEFPYPSGEGLHVGHPRSSTALDIIARKRRMEGYSVLFPIGWDAFGLPTENYAIRTGIHPRIVTERNIRRFREQLKRLGFSFDYSREVNTTDPAYYKWTQWIFLQLFDKGLAYKARIPVNWCLSCNVGLANEEVVGGHCERCGGEVARREKSQWMLRITAYAEKLLAGLDALDYQERIKTQQRNWIGRSEGALIRFPVMCAGGRVEVPVYTTRPETLYGATYLVLAPEHPLIGEILAALPNAAAVRDYRELAAHRSDFERTESPADAGKTGVPLAGVYAENPATGERIPVWIGDYVLAGYGTGAVMAVPAHDDRDFAFARAHGLPARTVITGGVYQDVAYTDETAGTLVGSGRISGLGIAKARAAMIQEMTNRGYGRSEVRYHLRDWVFSRQRYWGEPIPLVECPACGWVPVDEADLPVLLPETESYRTSPDGESPLAGMSGWVDTPCPRCGGPAHRETDTMPQWAGSSWYFLRYTDPHNPNRFADPEKLRYWLPVDWYNGGMEHTTLHLLYSRFWHLFLSDIGCVPTPEPYARRTSHGMVFGENGEKMSKSRGNVINPDAMVDQFGADAFRVYEMFMGAFDQAIPWSTRGLGGCRRFLERVWGLRRTIIGEDHIRPDLLHKVHGMIDKVGGDYEKMKFNTAIAAMMSFVNEVIRLGGITREELRILLLLLHPVVPHITEELWEQAHLGRKPLHLQVWPVADTRWLSAPTVELAIQVAGRIVARINLPTGTAAAVIEVQVLAHPAVAAALAGRTARRVVVVPDRLVNIVV